MSWKLVVLQQAHNIPVEGKSLRFYKLSTIIQKKDGDRCLLHHFFFLEFCVSIESQFKKKCGHDLIRKQLNALTGCTLHSIFIPAALINLLISSIHPSGHSPIHPSITDQWRQALTSSWKLGDNCQTVIHAQATACLTQFCLTVQISNAFTHTRTHTHRHSHTRSMHVVLILTVKADLFIQFSLHTEDLQKSYTFFASNCFLSGSQLIKM